MNNKGNIIFNEIVEDGSSKSFREVIPNITYDKGRIGIGRKPLHSYIFDLDTSTNKRTTSFHIGDGTHGFSLGNGTNTGFLPEIIGVGSDENDAGLYFVGIAGNDISSNTPLIILDARNSYSEELTNRPIFGVTSADYENYALLLDTSQNLYVNGDLHVNDIIFNGISLIDTINILIEEIEILKNKPL
ncbi:hypothetical protein M0Q50_06005 [bacterium]|jgi:hypothetical protein|nr:hypothetical protein [bacterium]